jgi:hypothetical protein
LAKDVIGARVQEGSTNQIKNGGLRLATEQVGTEIINVVGTKQQKLKKVKHVPTTRPFIHLIPK